MNSLPDLQKDIVCQTDNQEGATNKSVLCEEMGIETNAIQPFKPEEAISMFLNSDMLKNCVLYDSHTVKKFYDILGDEKVAKTLEILFWMVYLIKFDPEKKIGVINELRRNIGFLYSKMFGHIDDSKEDSKEEILM